VPVLLVGQSASAARGLDRLLVAIDESVGAALALAVAAELAQHAGATLVILRVVAPFPESAFDLRPGADLAGYVDPEWDVAAVAGAQRHIDGLAQQLLEQGLTVMTRAALGSVSPTFVQTAAEMETDMIVMGTHARSGPVRKALGSVAEAVVQAASVPVLLVREAPERATSSAADADESAASDAA
jgi:nucleotide-binding universal stress UspA family protein